MVDADRGSRTSEPRRTCDPVARAARVAALGLGRPLTPVALGEVRAATTDTDPRVQAAAVAALARAAPVRTALAALGRAARDPAAGVRRRAADVAPVVAARRRDHDPALVTTLVGLLGDDDVTVVEAAAWALGELGPAIGPEAVAALSATVTAHREPLAREAAVAALGAVGDPAGLPAVLGACADKPAVRRRAVLALAPFTGPEVDAALAAASTDRDWQVRQGAEDLSADGDRGD